jgi:hypothetical protein
VIAVVAAIVDWRLFFPGLMSADSIAQYQQALDGRYSDWHPPLMAIVLHYVFSAGGALGLLMLAQCLGGVLGLRALARATLRLLFADRLAPRRVEWLSLSVALLLLLPWTPLTFHLMTFWKDTWAMVFMLWLGASTLDLHLRGWTPTRALAVVVLGAALALVRHNAVVVLPVLGLALAVAAPGSRRRRAALAAGPLLLYLAGNPAMTALFRVEERHVDQAIMVLDLVGLCAEGPRTCAQLPWTRAHIRDPAALARYRPGDMGFIYWEEPRPVDPAIASDYPRLRAEYRRAWRQFPRELARLKLRAFAGMLGVDRTSYYFHREIVANPFRLALNGRFAGVRRWLAATLDTVASSGARWLSGAHLVWIVIDALGVAALYAASFLPRLRPARTRLRVLACVLLVPLAYYASYLFASPVPDFRFMYPSTLFVQCVALSGLGGALVQKPTGRTP